MRIRYAAVIVLNIVAGGYEIAGDESLRRTAGHPNNAGQVEEAQGVIIP